jgi:single-stranded-DNA-specific exonuclease
MLQRWPCRQAADPQPAELQALARPPRPPLVATLRHQRGVTDPAEAETFLAPRLRNLTEPTAIAGLATAARRIARAVCDNQPIVIYGDYDVDGVTASAILWHILREAGANVTTYVPHRIDEGYGLNSEALDHLAQPDEHGRLPLVITVDCGISAADEAHHARQIGLELIITDHHHFDPDKLPPAHYLVHPRLTASPDDPDTVPREPETALTGPSADLCGAGVAFKLAWQFAKEHCATDRLPEAFRDLLMDLLSYVALGTVADVVPLVGENRVLTIFGLNRVKSTRFEGLNAMIDAARLRDEKIGAYHVGFVLGPRLNACGRMGHAREAVRLLTTATGDEAAELAKFLTQENDRRRSTEREIYQEAQRMVREAGYDAPDHRAIVLGKEDWHPGVIGIVASRLVETFSRPVVMLSYENGTAKGSARSVEGVSIHEAFCACQQHLAGFGGHTMAAGLSLPVDNVEAFRQALVHHVNQQLQPEDLVGLIRVDATVSLEDCGLPLFNQLEQLGPFGRGNPAPRLLIQNAILDRDAERLGQGGKHLSLFLRQGQTRLKAIGFQMGHLADQLPAGQHLALVFEPKVSTFRGTHRPELHLLDIALPRRGPQPDTSAEPTTDAAIAQA